MALGASSAQNISGPLTPNLLGGPNNTPFFNNGRPVNPSQLFTEPDPLLIVDEPPPPPPENRPGAGFPDEIFFNIFGGAPSNIFLANRGPRITLLAFNTSQSDIAGNT
jgi:hypothetical protein